MFTVVRSIENQLTHRVCAANIEKCHSLSCQRARACSQYSYVQIIYFNTRHPPNQLANMLLDPYFGFAYSEDFSSPIR